jgi:hypothetical protein
MKEVAVEGYVVHVGEMRNNFKTDGNTFEA